MNLQTKIIQRLIHINEGIFFYPRLKKFYRANLSSEKCTILDVGANKGQSIDFFRNINSGAIIYSFEPNKKLHTILTKKYSLHQNIHLYNAGVSNIRGQLEFNENILDETSSFEPFNPDSKYLGKKARVLGISREKIIVDKYKVDVIRLLDFLNEHTDLFIDVLKIDVEGHELSCLEGLFVSAGPVLSPTKYPIKYIQLESHNDDMYLNNNQHEKIGNLLYENGFIQKAKIKHGFGDFYELIYENKNMT